MKSIIVVPDGLDEERAGHAPSVSWVYEEVLLAAAAATGPQDILVLAPANHFGQALTEHEAAHAFLRERFPSLKVLCPPRIDGAYLDTRANATALREFLEERRQWPLENVEIFAYRLHAPRAFLIFAQEGYRFTGRAVDRIRKVPRRPIVKRLWYYNVPVIHRMYELAAYFVFALRIR